MRKGVALAALISLTTVVTVITLTYSESARAAGHRAMVFAVMSFNFAKTRSLDELQQERDRYVVVDLRHPDDFARGHLPGAFNVPESQVQAFIGTAVKTFEQPVVLYSDDPVRTFGLVFLLRLSGYSNAYHLSEGVTTDSLG